MERYLNKKIVGFLAVLLLVGLAGKFFAERNAAGAPGNRGGYRPKLGTGWSTGSSKASSKPVSVAVISKPKKCNVFTLDSIPDNYYETKLKYSKGSVIFYVYNSNDLISRSVISSGAWEAGYVNLMEQTLNADPTLGLIDIGCNLGCFSMVGAVNKKQVVSVDANIQNIRRLRKSLLKNNLQDQVKLLYNGISNKYTEFSLSSPEKNNIGHSLLTAAKKDDANLVKSILMDDLLEVITFKRAFMKIDIEGHEYEAFQHADKLFTQVDILFVLMEWNWIGKHTDPKVPKLLMDFFKRFNYLAYPVGGNTPLPLQNYKNWPWDIIWKKQKK